MCNAAHSQVGDPSFAHSAGDGLHRRAQRVEQRGQLPRAFGLPALLHDEAGHGDHVGVEGAAVGHGAGESLELRV